jgi:hypothetical protein
MTKLSIKAPCVSQKIVDTERAASLLAHRCRIVEWPVHADVEGFVTRYAVRLQDVFFGCESGVALYATRSAAKLGAAKFRDGLRQIAKYKPAPAAIGA